MVLPPGADTSHYDDHLKGIFQKVTKLECWVEEVPEVPDFNPISIKINSAVKWIQNNSQVTHLVFTHAECLLYGVVERSLQLIEQYDHPDILAVSFETFMATDPNIFADLDRFGPDNILNISDSIEKIPRVWHKRPRSWWWYAFLFPVAGFVRVGGIDEDLAKGVAAEDDQFAYVWINNHYHIAVDGGGPYVIHLWHEPSNYGDNPAYIRNSRLAQKYRADQSRVHSNAGREWGKAKVEIIADTG